MVINSLNNKKLAIGILLFIGLGLLLGLHFWTSKKSGNSLVGPQEIAEENKPSGNQSASTTTPQRQSIINILPSYPTYQGEPIELVKGDGIEKQFPADVVKIYREELKKLAMDLSQKPGDVEGWLRVGVLKKFFNDYKGARDAWEYLTQIAPQEARAYVNLGNLYMLYLKEYALAEARFIKAVELDSQETYFLALADLYRIYWPDHKSDVPKLIQEAIQKSGQRVNYYLYLGSFYEEQGLKSEAKKNYEQVQILQPGYPGIAESITRVSQ